MAFSVQDDAGSVSDANAYVSVSYFENYFNDRGFDYASSYDTGDIQSAIIKATDFIDSEYESLFSGQRSSSSQTTAVPRLYFYDQFDNDVSSQIPSDFKKAVCEYAKAILEADSNELNPVPTYDDTGQNIKSKTERVEGAVTETTVYKDDYIQNLKRKYPKADSLIKKYLTKKVGASYSFLRG